MASDRAIATVGQTIVGLLKHGYALDETGIKAELYRPQEFEDPMDHGFSLLLYRISVNSTPRNLAPRRLSNGRRVRPSLPLDLHYLLTAWAQTAEKQHWMLGWAMRFLEDRNTLPAGTLNQYADAGEVFGPDEAVDLVCDPMSLPDHLQIWDKLKTKIPVSVSYVARRVLLDSSLEIDDHPAVRSRELLAGQTTP
jgi:hypothetical protein